MFEHIIYKHTLEIIYPEQDADELRDEFHKIIKRVQKGYETNWMLYMDSNQSFRIWRDVAMWFAEQHWGVIVVEDWKEYHDWQYLPMYDRDGNRIKKEVQNESHAM